MRFLTPTSYRRRNYLTYLGKRRTRNWITFSILPVLLMLLAPAQPLEAAPRYVPDNRYFNINLCFFNVRFHSGTELSCDYPPDTELIGEHISYYESEVAIRALEFVSFGYICPSLWGVNGSPNNLTVSISSTDPDEVCEEPDEYGYDEYGATSHVRYCCRYAIPMVDDV